MAGSSYSASRGGMNSLICQEGPGKYVYADSEITPSSTNDASTLGTTMILVNKEWHLKKMNTAMWNAQFGTPSTLSHVDSPEMEMGPEFALQVRIGTWTASDGDIATYVRLTRLPRAFAFASVNMNFKFRFDHCPEESLLLQATTKLGDLTSTQMDYPWTRSNNYIHRRLACKIPDTDNSVRVSILGNIILMTNNGYAITSHLRQTQHGNDEKKSRVLHWTETIGIPPDVTILLMDDETLAVHSDILRANSSCFAAQFTSFKESTEKHSRRIDMKAYHPLAVRALIQSVYMADSDSERCLWPILSSSSNKELSEPVWRQLADVFVLADQHFQYGLMRTSMQCMISYIPTPYLPHAKRLARFDNLHVGDTSPSATICKAFKEGILNHVRANVERFI